MDWAWQGAAPQVDGLIKFLPGTDRTPTITVGKGCNLFKRADGEAFG